MSVCACGQTMFKSEAWCKKCWAFWSAWFVRAQGVWIELAPTGLYGIYMNGGQCQCLSCQQQAAITALVDQLERSYL